MQFALKQDRFARRRGWRALLGRGLIDWMFDQLRRAEGYRLFRTAYFLAWAEGSYNSYDNQGNPSSVFQALPLLALSIPTEALARINSAFWKGGPWLRPLQDEMGYAITPMPPNSMPS